MDESKHQVSGKSHRRFRRHGSDRVRDRGRVRVRPGIRGPAAGVWNPRSGVRLLRREQV